MLKRFFIATDPDREGEFIAWRLSEVFTKAGFERQRELFLMKLQKIPYYNL